MAQKEWGAGGGAGREEAEQAGRSAGELGRRERGAWVGFGTKLGWVLLGLG